MNLPAFLSSLSTQLGTIISATGAHIQLVFIILAILWGIQIINAIMHYRLNLLGIYPRSGFGLIGIPCSPFLHGSFTHLFFNTVPLFILMPLTFTYGLTIFFHASLIIIGLGGGLVWLLGRRALHVGASGVAMGYWGFLLVTAIHVGGMMSIILGALVLYYLSSMVFNLLPTGKNDSFEGHIFGAVAGAVAAFLLT